MPALLFFELIGRRKARGFVRFLAPQPFVILVRVSVGAG
jgi:hypothetical protein